MDRRQIAMQTDEAKAQIATIYATLPTVKASTRDTTAVLLPLGDYRLDYFTYRGLVCSTQHFSGEMVAGGHSDVGLAREKLFNQALRSPFEWFVCIDSDIGFTAEDFAELVTVDHDRDYAVNAVYAKKKEDEEAVTMGLGFARIHRCVLEAIATHYPLRFVDEQLGECQQFCLQGVSGNGKMMREDVGFWFMCSLVGVLPRLLTTIELKHFGGRYEHTVSEFSRNHL